MPVPSAITDLTTTAASNSPAGGESARGTIDDYFRAHASFIAQLARLVSTSSSSRIEVKSDGSFVFRNNSSVITAILDSSGNLSVKGNVTAYASI